MKTVLLLLLGLLFMVSESAYATESATIRKLKEYQGKLNANGSMPSSARVDLQKIIDEGIRRCQDQTSNDCLTYMTPRSELDIVFQSCRLIPGGGETLEWGRCTNAIDVFMVEKGLKEGQKISGRQRSEVVTENPPTAHVLERGGWDKSQTKVAPARDAARSKQIARMKTPTTPVRSAKEAFIQKSHQDVESAREKGRNMGQEKK